MYLICLVSQAQEPMQIPSLTDGNSGKSRCLADLGSGNKRCWRLRAVQPMDIPNTATDVRFTKIRLIEMGLQPDGIGESFVVGLSWEGKSAGTFSFSGPRGILFAVGSVSKGTDAAVHVETFSDESLSQQFDRGVVFGESDPERRRLKTLEWLNEVVAPFLEKYVFNSPGQIKP